MKVSLFVLLLSLTSSMVSGKWRRSFDCPPPDEIAPCECHTHPKRVVKCDDVKNLDIIHEALEYQFSSPLPELDIANINTHRLPKDAFKNIATTKLVLTRSNIRLIDDGAFDGQERLRMLELSEDRLEEIPIEPLKRLPDLVTLSLAGNLIMKLDEKSLENFHDLKYLVLVENRLKQIERGAFPVTLKALSVGRNLLTTLNGTVQNLPGLEMLLAHHNRLNSVRGELRGLPSLTYLSLAHNNIRDISHSFDELPTLTGLNLAFNKLERADPGLRSLSNLRSLNLSNNYVVDLSEDLFRCLDKIDTLDLSGNYVTNLCSLLKPLKSLAHAGLANLNVGRIDYDCFREMKGLQYLDLSGNGLSSIDSVSAHQFPKLWSLNLAHNRLDSFRYGLKNLKRLVELDISFNHFAAIKEHQLSHNTALQVFQIKGNPWNCTDRLLFALENLASREVAVLGNPCDRLSNVL